MKNIQTLNELIEQRYISVQRHPSSPLYIYNYTASTQYERNWNEWTLLCRGLIMNDKYQIVARPFPKFFNIEEIGWDGLPPTSFDVYEKMDGSLGILYFIEDEPYIATRGSFTSEQATKANEMLYTKYKHTFSSLNQEYTYLFEIIYPQNRIVVDYGKKEELVLLAIIDSQSGEDIPLQDIGFPIVKQYDGVKDYKALQAIRADNLEGFIIKYTNGFRAKLKLEEYVRLHRILTQISNINIWEYLMSGMPFDELLERVPDEFYQWVKTTKKQLELNYREMEDICKRDFKILETRKETAAYFLSCAYPSILFSMLDNKNYGPDIWKRIKPKYEKPFQQLENEND